MIQLPEDRRPPLTPQLAMRVAILGGFALAMFAIIFFRLWFLQVLSGQSYVAQASVNRTRHIAVPAQRGDILDANGQILVGSHQTIAVQIAPQSLPVPLQPVAPGVPFPRPPAKDMAVYRRLARVLRMPLKPSKCEIVAHGTSRLAAIPCLVAQQQSLAQYANVTIKTSVPPQVHYYLAERADQFRGVQVQKIYLRSYPHGDLAAQLFGTVGPINSTEVKDPRYHGVPHTAIIGQSGLEGQYDRYLRGTDGTENVQVDSLGRFTRTLQGKSPITGDDLKLSLNTAVQRVGQNALQQSIDSNPPATGGAFVAMDPDNGQVYAMGSLPTFNPNVLTPPVSESAYKRLNNPSSNFPLINRAIQSVGPTGSTFKPITATAALQSGDWNIADTYDDTGQFCEGGGLCLQNSGHAAYGVVNLVDALRVSDDIFFYNLGARMNSNAPQGGPLQHWAHQFGIGRPTGVDLPGESSGTLPSPAWRAGRNKLESVCDNLTHPTATFPNHPDHKLAPGGCGLADGTNRPWSIGDNVNLGVGQGDVQVTPLQLVTAYSALANGGNVVVPHVGVDVQSPDGTVLQKIQPPPARHLDINPTYRQTILEGLREAASQPGGTSADVFGNFPEQVYGKTGTAQYNGQQDYSWYVCFVPDTATKRPIAVVVWVEQGGFGAVGAAPVAREILSQWFFGKPGPYQAGVSTTL
jgi:penicillin-binding protein 2